MRTVNKKSCAGSKKNKQSVYRDRYAPKRIFVRSLVSLRKEAPLSLLSRPVASSICGRHAAVEGKIVGRENGKRLQQFLLHLRISSSHAAPSATGCLPHQLSAPGDCGGARGQWEPIPRPLPHRRAGEPAAMPDSSRHPAANFRVTRIPPPSSKAIAKLYSRSHKQRNPSEHKPGGQSASLVPPGTKKDPLAL